MSCGGSSGRDLDSAACGCPMSPGPRTSASARRRERSARAARNGAGRNASRRRAAARPPTAAVARPASTAYATVPAASRTARGHAFWPASAAEPVRGTKSVMRACVPAQRMRHSNARATNASVRVNAASQKGVRSASNVSKASASVRGRTPSTAMGFAATATPRSARSKKLATSLSLRASLEVAHQLTSAPTATPSSSSARTISDAPASARRRPTRYQGGSASISICWWTTIRVIRATPAANAGRGECVYPAAMDVSAAPTSACPSAPSDVQHARSSSLLGDGMARRTTPDRRGAPRIT
jgi:hypothetical protein